MTADPCDQQPGDLLPLPLKQGAKTVPKMVGPRESLGEVTNLGLEPSNRRLSHPNFSGDGEENFLNIGVQSLHVSRVRIREKVGVLGENMIKFLLVDSGDHGERLRPNKQVLLVVEEGFAHLVEEPETLGAGSTEDGVDHGYVNNPIEFARKHVVDLRAGASLVEAIMPVMGGLTLSGATVDLLDDQRGGVRTLLEAVDSFNDEIPFYLEVGGQLIQLLLQDEDAKI